MDENRVFMTKQECPTCQRVPLYAGNHVQDMRDLVARDKNHASVFWYSFCNEGGCGDFGSSQPALDFKLASYEEDGSRPVSGNMGWISPTTPSNMSAILDIMGFSHAGDTDILAFHQQEPQKPLVMSECCSCETQRGEAADMRHAQNLSRILYTEENSKCNRQETQTSNAQKWMAGTFVWTLHDYCERHSLQSCNLTSHTK